MGRILAIDLGRKRSGLAVTDPLKLIARPLDTVDTRELIGYIKSYGKAEPIEEVIIGFPLNLDGTPTHATALVTRFIGKFQKVFPDLPIRTVDESFTSKWASQEIQQMGLRRSRRREKGLIDQIAATSMLQDYLESFR